MLVAIVPSQAGDRVHEGLLALYDFRLAKGEIMDVGAERLDVYNKMVGAMGAKHRLGPVKRERRHVISILA